MRALKNLAITITVVVLVLAAFIAYHLYSDVPVTTTEVFRDDEAAQARRAAENFIDVISETKTDYAARGAHAKGHACVKAWFRVVDSLAMELRHGVFQQPGMVFKSWIRFSNGASNLAKSHDGKNDSRGMAIKLINIQNAGLQLAAEDDTQTQEFLMHNNPVFFSANIEDYNRLVESENKIFSFLEGKNPFRWRLRELRHVFDTLAPPPYSPLWDEYFSNTAYRLGPHNIKFSAQPCSAIPESINPDRSDPDFLRLTMVKELNDDAACFDFMVQLQVADRYMPVEDPSIEWKESDSSYIKVARIEIPVQQFDTPEQQQFCEDLSFSPWNALSAHRPVGQLNRIRKQVYAASSRYRHEQNRRQIPAALDW